MELSTARYEPDEQEHAHTVELTVLEASRQARVTQSAIIRWIRNGYLEATPSEHGWMIPADQLARAADAANEARGTSPVPRRTTPSLVPVPTPIRYTVERRAAEVTQEAIGEHIVAPLAELIRDQIDIVHDQAEVIGWLQAERSRLSAELERQKQEETAPRTSTNSEPPVHQADIDEYVIDDTDLYDEVLSLLWKDESAPDSAITQTDEPEAESDPEDISHEASTLDNLWEPVYIAEEQAETSAPVAAGDAPEGETAPDAEPEVEHELKLEDYADPSWFFSNQSYAVARADARRTPPTLQPIVPRKAEAVSTSEEQRELHKMIDETERKIADLWRTQEDLRRMSPQVINPPPQIKSPSSRWSRIWPLRR